MTSGYFLVDAVSNEVLSGLTWNEELAVMPSAKKTKLKSAAKM